MKKLLFLFLCVCIVSSAQAGVRSLGDSGDLVQRSSPSSHSRDKNLISQPIVNLKSINTAQRCAKGGFTMRECPSGYVPVYPCPEDSQYFRDCCPQEYRYTEAECRQKGLEPSTETCLVFHACRKKEAPQQTSASTENNTTN